MAGLPYSDEHHIFRDSFRRFCAEEITPNYKEWAEKGHVPREIWLKMGEYGFLCPWLPEEYGGAGADYLFSVIIGEELVRAGGYGLEVSLHADVSAPYVYSFGSEEIKKKWLPKAASGEAIFAIGLTEPDTGSDLAALKTRAVREGDYYRINGSKVFITQGHSADLVVLACKTDLTAGHKGISLIAVPTDSPGFIRGGHLDKMGARMADTAELFFDDCMVPAGNLLGEEGQGFKYMMSKLQPERLEVCIKAQAHAEWAFDLALQYAKDRKAFGKRIGDFQHNSFKLAEMATDVQLGRTFLDTLIQDFLNGIDIVQRVSMAKYWIGEMVNRVAYHAVQLHGGYGYMNEYDVCRIYKDVRGFSIFAGTSEIMKLIVSRGLGLTS